MRRIALILCVAAPALADAPRRLTMDDVVAMALASNPRITAARARSRGADEVVRSSRGRLLPSVRVSEEYQHYNAPFDIPFGPMSFRAREEDVSSFAATADQPLMGLLRLSQEYFAQRDGAGASAAQVKAAEALLRESVQVEYVRLFQARAVEEIARESERELGEQVSVVAAKVTAGVLTNADLLRVKVAAANARQQEIAGRSQERISRAVVLAAIGLPLESEVELAEPTALLQGEHRARLELGPAEGLALHRRPELLSVKLTANSLDHVRRARLFGLLPDVDAEAGYLRLDGQVFAPANSAFVGVRAQWAIWEWGASWFLARAALAQAEAASFDVEAERRQIGVEVATRLAQLDSAVNAVDVARETIASAEEAYRITDALVKAGTATTTDLLDSHSALTQARLNLTRARYDEAIANLTLARALGE